jgi:hypothetical protein
MMKAFLATVLSLIATGVMLIAYGLLTPRVATADVYPAARPILANERVGLIDDGYAPFGNRYASYPSPQPASAYPTPAARSLPVYDPYPAPVQRVATPPARRTTSARVERSSGRDWQKTAMVIGGTTAAGAGLGAIFGGKKGALIGAAIGGGASALYEVNHR